MTPRPLERYLPRAVSDLGLWDIADLTVKVYGLVAEGKEITDAMVAQADSFVRQEVLPLMVAEGDDNGLGFVIIHPGDIGMSISAHWWIQGSVLCQHIHRKLYSKPEPMDTVTRPVIACVWELALIHAEQEAWRNTMMTAAPSPAAYLAARFEGTAV